MNTRCYDTEEIENHRSRPDPPESAHNTVQASAMASPPEVHLRS